MLLTLVKEEKSVDFIPKNDPFGWNSLSDIRTFFQKLSSQPASSESSVPDSSSQSDSSEGSVSVPVSP